ncbi:hypothetical protein GALL_286420 [mine drainage metagenome]|uniref:Transposase n=1 Tax=mine drainage metagenome TaxID=410659 RepID=A0A1J5R0I6_9ZZZZ
MRTWAGWVYVFIVDVFAQRIVGWHAMTSKPAELVLIPLRIPPGLAASRATRSPAATSSPTPTPGRKAALRYTEHLGS